MTLPQRFRMMMIFSFLLLVFIAGVKYLFPLLAPFVLGLLIAYLIESPVDFVEKKFKSPRWLSVLVILFCTLVLTCLALTLIFSRIYMEIKDILTDLPEKLLIWSNEVNKIQILIKERFELPEEFWNSILFKPESIIAYIKEALQKILSALKAFPSFIFNLFLSGLAAYFLSRDKEKIVLFFFSFFPEGWWQPTLRLHQEIILSTFRFIKIQILLILITSLLTAFFLGIFGFPRAGLIGLTVGLLDFLPMIGPSAFFLPWAGWVFFNGRIGIGILLITILSVILGVRELAEVRLIKQNLDIHPLAALLSVYLGLRLFGMYGFFIGPIVFIIMRSFYHGILPLLNEV